MDQPLDIRDVARRTGLTSRALRFYEARGLVAPLRSASGRRHYGPAELERLHQVMAMKRAGLTLGQIEKLGAGRKTDLAGLIVAQLHALDEQRDAIDAATFCSLIRQGETLMSQEKWFEDASGFMTEEQREAVARARAAMPADADRRAAMEQFNALNARIKAALPLDPASEPAQRFLDERDTMLAPFLAAMPPEVEEMSRTLRGKIEQGRLASPIDEEVHHFYKGAARAREAMKGR